MNAHALQDGKQSLPATVEHKDSMTGSNLNGGPANEFCLRCPSPNQFVEAFVSVLSLQRLV